MSARWLIRARSSAAAARLAASLDCSLPLADILVQRGFSEAAGARRFLEARLADLHDPYLMKDMDRAVARVRRAIDAREAVALVGDYDVDGLTAVAQVQLFFAALGQPVQTYIPDRLQEGYGLSESILRRAAAKGATLVITLDCGISDADAIAHARALGLDVIVADHHRLPERLPDAYAILNPRQPDCAFPCKSLAAAGIAFHLLVALRSALRNNGSGGPSAAAADIDLRRYTDLTALGTVADMVPLEGANRILARFGLGELSHTRRPGIVALRRVAGQLGGEVTSSEVAFQLAPRLNAAGRVANANLALSLLTATDFGEALGVAMALDRENRRRRTIEGEVFADACRRYEAGEAGADPGVLVLGSPDWHPGVLGIVAARLAQRFTRPVVLLAVDGDTAKGSARGVEGFDVFQALSRAADLLQRFGGHPMAGGLTVTSDRVAALRERLCASAAEMLPPGRVASPLAIDLEVPLADVDEAFATELQRLGPFGVGNPQPLLLARHAHVDAARTVGTNHLRLTLSSGRPGSRPHTAIGFGLAAAAPPQGSLIDVVFSPQLETWRGERRLALHVKDLAVHGTSAAAEARP